MAPPALPRTPQARAFPTARWPGRSRWASTRRRCAPSCARSRACSSIGELVNLRRRARACTSSCATPPARSPARLAQRLGAMLARGGRAPADGMQLVVAGGCDYYPGSATSSPGFSFAVHDLRIAGEGDLLARIERLRQQLARRACWSARSSSTRPLLPRVDRRDHRRERQGPRRPARGARAPRLGRDGWCGRFAPVQDRHAAPAIVPRARRTSRRWREVRGGDRRARRRLAGGPAVLQRRDAVPHGCAARRAGDRLGRSPHRPHAARRRRGRELLDAHPCRRGGGRASTAARARAGDSWRRASSACATTAAAASLARRAPCSTILSRARPPRTWSASAGRCTSSCARLRAGSRRRLECRARARPRGARVVLERKAASTLLDCRERRPRELEQLALALAGHDPQRTLERGYALVAVARRRAARRAPTPPARPGAAAALRRRHAARAGARAMTEQRRPAADERQRRSAAAAGGEPATRRPRRASRRSSAAWTPARPASMRRSRCVQRGQDADRALRRVSWRRSGDALEELRLDELVSRLERERERMSTWERLAELAAARSRTTRSSRCRPSVSSDFERKSTVIHLRGRRRGGARRGRHLRRRRPRDPAGGRSRRCRSRDASRSASFCEHLAELSLFPEPPQREVSARYRTWAYESAALDLALRQAGTTLHAALGREPAAGALRRLAAPRRAAVARAARASACSATRGCASSSTRPAPGMRR